jgi:hypothetical protein
MPLWWLAVGLAALPYGVAHAAPSNPGASPLPVLASITPTSSATAAGRPASPSPDGPPRPEGLTEVGVGVYLLGITGIDEVDETFDIDGYLYLRWSDPRLAGGGGKGPREVRPADVWWPHTTILNARNDRTVALVRILVWPDGRVLFRERFNATVLSDMDLRRFPFDTQHVRLTVGSVAFGDNGVSFAPAADLTGHDPELRLDSWAIGKATGQVVTPRLDPDGTSHARFLYEVPLRREYGYYMWKVILPLLLIVGTSWSLFWLETSTLEPSLDVGVTSFLAAIAFNFAVAGSLPPVSYMTVLDGFIFTCYTAIFLAIVVDVRTWLLHQKGRIDAAERTDRWCRWAFPTAFGVTCAALVARALWP